MKTCYMHGDPNKPVRKYYYYHGELRSCLIQPDPGKFDCYDTKKPGDYWEIIYERFNTTDQVYTVDYDIWAFKPAKINDMCTIKFPDGKYRHYFCIVEIWDGTFIIGWSMDLNGIVKCRVLPKAGQWSYYYKSYVASIWAGKTWLVWIYQWVPNSHFVIYRSTTGDMPLYYPVPIQEYHID